MILYDMEVSKYDWLGVWKDLETGEYFKIHNSNLKIQELFENNSERTFLGFNNKHYDNYIVKSLLHGADNALVKEINDYIIAGNQGFEHPFVQSSRSWFNSFDIRDDMRMGLSLKEIEGHMYSDISETPIPFDIDRPLTEAEVEEVFEYCTKDVDNSEKVLKIRGEYFKTKALCAKIKALDVNQALYATNAKLTAMMLEAIPKERNDERDYEIPDTVDLSRIPKEVIDFFMQIRDPTIPDEELWGKSLTITIGGCKVKYGWGGVHGALNHYIGESTKDVLLLIKDVTGLYPSLMIEYGYISRNIPDPQIYIDLRDMRVKAKQEENIDLSNALKLVLVTAFGALLNKFNALYDPKMGRSTCITGQLLLTQLLTEYILRCKTFKLINFNTDGIAFEIDECEKQLIEDITKEWEITTRLNLEEEEIKKIAQKDVNNYICKFNNGKIKLKGGYVKFGVSSAGAWSINNNAIIIKKAIADYFLEGTDPTSTIYNCNDPKEFQLIAKAGGKYKEVYHIINGEKVTVQKVNRVFACRDMGYERLYKVKAENGSVAKIESLPEHCIISNDLKISVDAIDKQWYNEIAVRKIAEFKGGRKMTEAKKTTKAIVKPTTVKEEETPKNIYQKLIMARNMFIESGVKKTGRHLKPNFMYFELADIVPIKNKIFEKLGLVDQISITKDEAILFLLNTDDDTEDYIKFMLPSAELSPIISSTTGNEVTNGLQRIGATTTYMRRYLYMLLLDIVENDAVDGDLINEPVASKAPASVESRQSIKQKLNSTVATPSQLENLAKALLLLKEAGDNQEFIDAIIPTMSTMTKQEVDDLLIAIGDKLGG